MTRKKGREHKDKQEIWKEWVREKLCKRRFDMKIKIITFELMDKKIF